MTKYLVVFKDLKKQLYIEAPSDERANEWANVQLRTWSEESRFNVTKVVAAAKVVAAPPSDVSKKKTARVRKPKT
jgi:hypothetical protein